jgi:serine/threonine-protein kinase
MSPEQALGEVKQLDRRADVYSLGATLYALLTAQPPIEGSNPLVVLARVALDEPKRPRAIDPDVPADLEAITMKCLEKDRTARYDSAKALADDLGRFLAGEPVEARASAGLGYRLRKTLRRHARLVAGLAVVVVVVAVALGFALRERRQAAQREVLARRFTERVGGIEAMARYAALAPAHALGPDRAELRRQMKELAAQVRAGGDVAEGPGYYALGRGHLALDDADRAAIELKAAWARNYRPPRVAYALALAEGHRYQRELRELARAQLSKEQREQRRRELALPLEPALRSLRASGGGEGVSPAYVAALRAFYEGRFDDALAELDALDRGGDARVWFYEAPLLRGEVLHARAVTHPTQALAAADLEGARRALAAAASIGRSAPAVHRARAELELTALWKEVEGGGAVDAVGAPYERGVEAAEQVLALLPDDVDALTLRSRLRRVLAAYRQRRGEDVAVLRMGAVADAKRALELDPARREARFALVDSYKQWAQEDQRRDPSEQLRQAVALLEAIPASDRDADFHFRRGLIHGVWADHQDRVGQDSSMHRTQAISAYDQAVQKDDRLGTAWLSLCKSYTLRASRSSKDPGGDLEEARKAVTRARELEPTNYLTYVLEGNLYEQLATLEQKRGGDPASMRTRAIERYREGLAVTRNKYFHTVISDALLQQAQEARKHGRDPRPSLDDAESEAQLAVAAAPGDAYGHLNIGLALLARAEHEQAREADPVAAARAARAARDAEEAFRHKALEPLRDDPTLCRSQVDLYLLLAKIERDLDPGRVKLAQAALLCARDLSEAEQQDRRVQLRALSDQWQARQRSGAAREPPR